MIWYKAAGDSRALGPNLSGISPSLAAAQQQHLDLESKYGRQHQEGSGDPLGRGYTGSRNFDEV
jgi:hypothetical protein